MSKLVIVLFMVLAVVATNASRTPEELQDYRQYIETNYIDEAQTYINTKQKYAVDQYDYLEKATKERGEQAVANWNDHIQIVINQAKMEIEFRKQEVMLMEDAACMQDATHLADKTAEASTNLTTCVFDKMKRSNNIDLDAIAESKNGLHYQVENLRDKLDPCINDNKSDAVKAEICLLEVKTGTLPIRFTMDDDVSFRLEGIRNMFKVIQESFELCNKEYGATNYSKFTKSIVDKVAKCLQAGDRTRHIRGVSPVRVRPNGQPLPNSTPISIQRHMDLQETQDEYDLLAVE